MGITGPTTQKPPLVRGCTWQKTVSTVETLLLDQCWTNVTITLTCFQHLQQLPNVGHTIDCYLGELLNNYMYVLLNCKENVYVYKRWISALSQLGTFMHQI